MKCPNCNTKLPMRAHLLNNYKCKSCGGVISHKIWVNVFTTIMAFLSGKLFYSEYYLSAFLLATLFFIVMIIKMPSSLIVEFENNKKE